MQVEVKVPESWAGQELWLHWLSQAEALMWSKDGEILQVRLGTLTRDLLSPK